MQSSTVRRKRLISPVGLLLISALFAVAFGLLKSGWIASRQSLDTTPNDSPLSVDLDLELPADELQTAYLKAQKSTGKVSDAQLGTVIVGLLQEGRVEESKQLLIDFPDMDITASQRLTIDLEIVATESPVALAAALSKMIESAQQYPPVLVKRAVELSKQLSQPALTDNLYDLLASHGQVDPVEVYRDCGDYMASINEAVKAINCIRQAKSVNDDPDVDIDLAVSLLPVLAPGSAEQQKIVDNILNRPLMSIEQLTKLAPVLLAIERPDAAYRIYARLALQQPDKADQWLPLAARWAEAANRPVDAAVFLDALLKQVEEGEKLAILKQVESLLIGAGRSKEAYKRIKQRIENNPGDLTEYPDAIKLAHQLGDTGNALSWNAIWLKQNPQDPAALNLQIDLVLAEGDLPLALQVSEQLVSVQPANVESRERLARISEWNGLVAKANRQWSWLSKASNQPDETKRHAALREVVRLSSATHDAAKATRALRELTLLTRPSDDEIEDLVRFFVLDGRPHEASKALKDINIMHGRSAFVIRLLAKHEYEHGNFAKSLAAWNQLETHFGRTAESTMNRIELLWKVDRTDDAVRATEALRGQTLFSQANDQQLRLLSEIAWRESLMWLSELIRPRIDSIEARDMRAHYGRRAVQTLRDSGHDEEAIDESMKLWSSTGEKDFALSAMQLALKLGNQKVLSQFTPEQGQTTTLQSTAAYWVQLAEVRLRESDKLGARSAYVRALNLDDKYIDAVAGIIWMDIGATDPAQLQTTLDKYKAFAETEPRLWQPMAVGYLQLGAASLSLSWFEKVLDQIDTDYAMLLTYADALEYSGRASDALNVRRYALQKLRPVLINGSRKERNLLLRQYAQLSARYAGSAHTESLVGYLVSQPSRGEEKSVEESLWREDVAISWLMSTQRLEQARILMANLHSKRLQAPAWQRLALAIKDDDQQALRELIQATGPLSIGNHILALRQLGKDREAYAMAQLAMTPGQTGSTANYHDVQIASQQYGYLREVLPSFVSGQVTSKRIDQLSMTERGFSVRHSLAKYNLGVGLQVSSRTIESEQFIVKGNEQMSDAALSLFFGNSLGGGRITTGLMSADDKDIVYGSARWYQRSSDRRREYAMELAYNERATQSAELLVSGIQNRASISMDTSIGRLPFFRMQLDATRISTRINRDSVAEGLGGEIVVGLRGAAGAHSWSTSVQAGQISYQRAEQLPGELQLMAGTTMDSVLVEQSRTLSVEASIARGGVNTNFPTVNSPRYFLTARLGQNWPSKVLGFQVNAGAGIRVLGGDELSFTFTHDTQANGTQANDGSSLGVNYRYHF